ncbi:hypothetical protein B296_00059199, partial [Ensete ventricosum]
VVCAKVRDGDKRIVQIKEGNPKARHVVIVDDLVQSGGTLIECQTWSHDTIVPFAFDVQKVLAAHGAGKVSAYVTHGVFPKRSWERFLHNNTGTNSFKKRYWVSSSMAFSCSNYIICSLEGSDDQFAYFWITDSCPLTVKDIANKAPFEVLSLADSIANALQI